MHYTHALGLHASCVPKIEIAISAKQIILCSGCAFTDLNLYWGTNSVGIRLDFVISAYYYLRPLTNLGQIAKYSCRWHLTITYILIKLILYINK